MENKHVNKPPIYLIFIIFYFSSCTNGIKSNFAAEQGQIEKQNCKLPRVVEGAIALGFPEVKGLTPYKGQVTPTDIFFQTLMM
ncbi:hypothetical protein [Cyclobacterium xiamenense]|uniref:hypothetical protein n=1 Tax=Cyclobacterium xiamenense TaxID=1297121 RepID=UPI0035D0099A